MDKQSNIENPLTLIFRGKEFLDFSCLMKIFYDFKEMGNRITTNQDGLFAYQLFKLK
jgi:hypothetical protein